MPYLFLNCDRFFMHASMRWHIAMHFVRGHRLAGQEGADTGAFCLWCGNTDGKCSTSVHGKKIDSNCSLAYHRLRLNSAATPTAMNPSTNLLVRCKVLDCRKWHCTYAMPHHMAQAHPGVSHDYTRCSGREKTKVLQAFDNFRAPLPPKAKPAAPPAVCSLLLSLGQTKVVVQGGAKRRRRKTPKMSKFVSVCVVFLQHFPRRSFGFYRIRIS